MTRLQKVTEEAAGLLEQIQNLFKPGAKVTLLVRNPDINGDAGFLLTDDSLDAVLREIRKRMAKGESGGTELLFPDLSEAEQCSTCGDLHEGRVPYACETGDGV